MRTRRRKELETAPALGVRIVANVVFVLRVRVIVGQRVDQIPYQIARVAGQEQVGRTVMLPFTDVANLFPSGDFKHRWPSEFVCRDHPETLAASSIVQGLKHMKSVLMSGLLG